MRTSALFGAKNFRFFKIYGVSARTRGRGLSQCGQGRSGVNFSRFGADVFYEQLLMNDLANKTFYICLQYMRKLKNIIFFKSSDNGHTPILIYFSILIVF